MDNRIKKAFKKAYTSEQSEYSELIYSPNISSGYSKLAIFIMLLGWLSFFTYIFVLVDVSDFNLLLESSLSTDSEGIRYRALLFFTPLIFTILGYLVNKIDATFRKTIAYHAQLKKLTDTLENKVKEQTQAIEESNESLRAEMHAKNEAYRSLLLLEKAVKTTNTGITFKDTNNIIRFINDADARMHGYEPSELIGKDAGILTSTGIIKKLDINELKQIKSWARQSVNRHKDGTTFPVQLVSDAVLDDSGEPLGTVTTCQDISEVVLLKEQLRDALRENEALSNKLQQLTDNKIQT